MPYQNTVFINLPVSDLERSVKFYTALGFVPNKTFADKNSTMVSLPLGPGSNPHESPIKIMLLNHSFFSTFLPPGVKIADPNATAQSILCFSRESREACDEFVAKAKEAGGRTEIREKTEMEKMMEKGGMYGSA
jgi:uncharacterized protein